jgi:hypothetical protein
MKRMNAVVEERPRFSFRRSREAGSLTVARALIRPVTFGLFWLIWFATGSTLVSQSSENGAPGNIVANEAIVAFPNQVTFRLEWESESPIVEARLTYDVVQISCLEAAAEVPVEVTGPTIEWTWVMIRSGNPPPGSELWWEWTLTDVDGNEFTTERQSITLTDDRFEWRTLESEGIQLYWYQGDDVGPTLLDAAVTGLDRLQQEMGIELKEGVQIYIYGSAADMQQAVLYIQDWAGGVAFSEHNVILIGVPPDLAQDWGRNTVRHELTHLVVGQFGYSCVGGSRPTWLNEGLAVFGEGDLSTEFAEALESAIEDDQLSPVRSLNGPFPAGEAEARIAYAQSYSLVAFLLDEFGQEKMQSLTLTLAQGRGYDEALEEVYGFNEDGLETAWREAVGAARRQIQPTATPISAASIPTYEPISAPVDMPTPPSAAELPPASSESPGICSLGMLPLLLLLSGAVAFPKQRKWNSID